VLDRILHSTIGQQFSGTTIQARMIRGTSGTFALRIGNVAIKFLTTSALTNLLGKEHFGVYSFAMAWLLLLITPTLFGMDRLLVRNVAAYRKEKNWASLRGLLLFAPRLTGALSVIVMGIALAAAWLTYDLTGRPALLKADHADLAETALYTLLITMLLLPIWTLLLQQQSAMQGLQHIIVSQFPEQVLHPILFLIAIGGVYLIAGKFESAQWAMLLRTITAVIALVASFSLLRRAIPKMIHQVEPVIDARLWLASALPFAISRGLVNLDQQLDVLMLGVLDSTEAVSFYAVSQRGVQFISLLLISVNVALAPQIVNLYADGKRAQLQRLLAHSARLVLAVSIPIAVAFIVGGKFFLLIFGKEYTAAHMTLIVLSFGQIINIATGSVVLLLMMTQRERQAMYGLVLMVALHITLNAILIPTLGVEGAAVAGAVSIGFGNFFMLWVVMHEMQINPTALGDVRAWKIWKR
jgi:O-antigen/teichoic acid export membrane protein